MRKHCMNMSSVEVILVSTFLFIRLGRKGFLKLTYLPFIACICIETDSGGGYDDGKSRFRLLRPDGRRRLTFMTMKSSCDKQWLLL